MFDLKTPWKILLASLFLMVAMLSPLNAHAAFPAQEQSSQGQTVRLMVKIDPATRAEQISMLSNEAILEDSLPALGWEIIEVDANAAPQIIAELQATDGILEVTPDFPLELAWNPNDPGYKQGSQWSIDKIGADIAWEFSSGQAITVAVVDSGIDPNHPDLKGRLVPGYNFVDKNTDTTDLCGHGTHVSGIIAAEANNGIGVAGVAPQAVIMPIKVIGASCTGSYSRLMQGILYAVEQGVRVISITSGGGFDHAGLHDAIIYARSQGVLVVVAAGNRGSSVPFYPGSYEEAFTISGTDSTDARYNMTNFGNQVDLAAPAVAVYSTYVDKEQGSTYAYMTGTSMATPHVAAVAALVLAIDPKLSLTDLENTLINSATDLGAPGWDIVFGWGRVTAWRAVAAVSPAAGNVRLGHFRVPEMSEFNLISSTISADANSITLSWAQTSFDSDHTVVIYRSPVPVFDAAEDIAEVAAATADSYVDIAVVADQEYYYWLVQADNDVEVATTQVLNSKLTTAPQAPQEPTEPEQPTQPETPVTPTQPARVAMYMPLLQR